MERTISWNNNTTYAFGFYRLITKYLGIWPLTCHKWSAKVQIIFVCALEMIMIINLIGEMYLNFDGINDKIETTSLISCAIMTIIKVSILRWNNEKIYHIILSAVEDWSSIKRLDDDSNMKRCAKLARTIVVFQMISSYIVTATIIHSGLAPPIAIDMTNSSHASIRNLPFHTVCFFGEIPLGLYICVYILQSIQLVTTSTGNVGCDCYFFGLAMHLTGQVERLAKNMEHLGDEFNNTTGYRKKFAHLIRRQNLLFDLANNLESTFHLILLAELSALTYQISLVALQIVFNIRKGNIIIVINNLVICQIFHIQLFLYCYAGERLSSELENLAYAIYKCQWFNMPTESNKNIILVTMRSHRCFRLTAGKVCEMHLENFKNIVKAVGSYFSVLLAILDE